MGRGGQGRKQSKATFTLYSRLTEVSVSIKPNDKINYKSDITPRTSPTKMSRHTGMGYRKVLVSPLAQCPM